MAAFLLSPTYLILVPQQVFFITSYYLIHSGGLKSAADGVQKRTRGRHYNIFALRNHRGAMRVLDASPKGRRG